MNNEAVMSQSNVSNAQEADFSPDTLKRNVLYAAKLCAPEEDLTELINKRVKDAASARLFLIAVTSIRSTSDIKLIFDDENNDYERLINERIADLYTPFDNLSGKINEANDLALKVTAANKEIRDMFQNEIKQSFEREKTAQAELIKQYNVSLEAKDKAYGLVRRQYDELKEQLLGLKEINSRLSEENESLKADVKITFSEEQPAADFEKGSGGVADGRQSVNLFNFFKKKRSKGDENTAYIYDMFVNEILMNKGFNNEQKSFLTGCLEEGMPYDEIKRLAKPELDVVMMKRLKVYYKKRVR